MSIQNPKFSDINDYIKHAAPEAQKILQNLRDIIHSEAPDVVELIRYDMPSYELNGKYIAHIAAFKKHIGVYGISIEKMKSELTPYLQEKGTMQFQLDETVPYDLFKRLVNYRVQKEILER